jgi:hypothetical protein
MIKSILFILTHKSYLLIYFQAFLFIYKLTMHYKFNNMHFRILMLLSDFMQSRNTIKNHPTNNEYLFKHILFSTIYLI